MNIPLHLTLRFAPFRVPIIVKGSWSKQLRIHRCQDALFIITFECLRIIQKISYAKNTPTALLSYPPPGNHDLNKFKSALPEDSFLSHR